MYMVFQLIRSINMEDPVHYNTFSKKRSHVTNVAHRDLIGLIKRTFDSQGFSVIPDEIGWRAVCRLPHLQRYPSPVHCSPI